MISLAVPTMLSANELWVQQKDRELQIVCAPSVCGKEIVAAPCDPLSLKQAKTYDATGKLHATVSAFPEQAVISSAPNTIAVVTVTQDEGFRSMTAAGEKPLSRKQAPDALETRYYLHYGKTLLAWNKAFTRPLGKDLEIVPLKNPLVMKPGDKLPIVVYYQGKPRAGIWVDDRTNDGIREKTDRRGRLMVTVGKRGLQIITAYQDEPYKNADEADKLSRTANLAYTVN